MPTWVLINQCQIITILVLKSDIIENSRIELRGIALPVPSNEIKVTFTTSAWYICDSFLFHIEIERKGGWIIGGGGQRVCCPSPSHFIGGPAPAPPPPPPLPPIPTPMQTDFS